MKPHHHEDPEDDPKVDVKGSVSNLHLKSYDKATQKTRTNSSAFFLTVNSNQRYQHDDPHLESDAKVFESKLVHVLKNLKSFTTHPEGDWSKEKILDAKVSYTVELGEKKMLHGHALVKVRHTTRIQLDLSKIRHYFREELGTNCYVNVKFLKYLRNEVNFMDYLDKFKKQP